MEVALQQCGVLVVTTVSEGELPAQIQVPILDPMAPRSKSGCPGFGLVVFSLTGATDGQGRPIYGEPQ